MNKQTLKRGQEVIYIKSDILLRELVVKAYYLEECNDNSGKVYLTTDEKIVQTFDQKNTGNTLDLNTHLASKNKIRAFSENRYYKYKEINKYLLEKHNLYHNATKFYLFRDDFPELYNAFGDNEELYKNKKEKHLYTHSELCNNIIKEPCFYKQRFWLHIIWKYFIGIFKHILLIVFFFKDLVANLYGYYFNYRSAIHTLNKFKKDKETATTNEVQERHDNEAIITMEKDIEKKKELYINNNLAFFTLILAVIVFVVTNIINNANMNKKDNEIEALIIKSELFEQEVEELKENTLIEILTNQNQINNNLMTNNKQLLEILNELKETNIENNEKTKE